MTLRNFVSGNFESLNFHKDWKKKFLSSETFSQIDRISSIKKKFTNFFVETFFLEDFFFSPEVSPGLSSQ